LGRVRRKILGLVALGVRPRKYRAKFEWIYGVPTVRQVKEGVSWTLRTPARIVKLGFKEENYLGVIEADTPLREATKSELAELFYKMMHKWVKEKEKEGFEAVWIKILPHSKIVKLLRGRSKVRDENTSIATLQLLAKNPQGLWQVFYEHGRRGIRLKLMPLKQDNECAVKKITLPRNVSKLEKTALLKVVKETLKKEGFQPLVYRVPRTKGRKRKEQAEAYRHVAPWDFVHKFLTIACTKDEHTLMRVAKDILMRAAPERRGVLYSAIREIWPLLQARFDYLYMKSMQRYFKWTFKHLRPFLMPYHRCNDLDAFNEAFSVLARQCMLLRDEAIDIYWRARRYWLHQDAYHFLERLLQTREQK